MANFESLIAALSRARVDFVIVGGFAARLRGAARDPKDLDVVYSKRDRNVRRLIEAIRPYSPQWRFANGGTAFCWGPALFAEWDDLTLSTSEGWLDLIGCVVGGGRYEDLLRDSSRVTVGGHSCLCGTLPILIKMKRAAARPQDRSAILELEHLLQKHGE